MVISSTKRYIVIWPRDYILTLNVNATKTIWQNDNNTGKNTPLMADEIHIFSEET